MNSIQKIIFISLLTTLLASCAYHEYNPSKPDEYAEYWCKSEHRNNSILAILETNQGKEDPIPNNCDIYYR